MSAVSASLNAFQFPLAERTCCNRHSTESAISVFRLSVSSSGTNVLQLEPNYRDVNVEFDFQFPLAERTCCNSGGRRGQAKGYIFQFPLAERTCCNAKQRARARCAVELSVSSSGTNVLQPPTGSVWSKPT